MAIKLDLDSNPNNGVNSTSSFTQGDEPIALFKTATLDTVSKQSDHADIIRISLGGAAQDGESLAVDLTGMNGFQQSFNPSTGILTISKGNGADAKWEKILQSVTYSNTNDDPVESRSIEVMAIDRSPSKITASGNHTETATATNTLTIDVICFMPGTNIAVPGGEAKVETLKPGDLVMTTAGEAKAVRWIGRQTVSRVFADPLRVLPIRVKAGALGENVPCRDLLISPDHAVLVDGVLVQAGALVNGSSIVRESDVPQVYTYYHVELDDHSLILAENVAAETFIDNVNRLGFDNWAEHEALYPDGKPIEEMTYPRANSFRQVPQATRLHLATRGEALYGGAAAEAA